RVLVNRQDDGTATLEVIRGDDEVALVGSLGVGEAPSDLLDGFVESPVSEPVPTPDPAPVLRLAEAPVGAQLATFETSLPQEAVEPAAMTPEHTLAGVLVDGAAYANPAGVSGRMSWYGHAAYDYAGPSIHVSSEVKYLRPVKTGEPIHIAA